MKARRTLQEKVAPKLPAGKLKVCPRCLEVRPIIPTRRICNECHRRIADGGDRRIAEGLSVLGFWDLLPEDRRRIWKTWVRLIVDQLLGPVVAGIMRVSVEELHRWYNVGDPNPPARLIYGAIESIVYLNKLEKTREPQGEETHPERIRSVPLDLALIEHLFI